MNQDKIRTTVRLIDEAKQEDLDHLLRQVRKIRSIPEILLPHMKNMSVDALGGFIGCSRAYAYRIMNGRQHPEQDVLLRIAFVLHLSVDETQEMLQSARKSTLTSSSPRDICVIFGLANRLDSEEMDQILASRGFPTLWPEEE